MLRDLSLSAIAAVFVVPTYSLAAVIGIALPLFMVTMASQNVPGVAVIRASGYEVAISPIIGWIGILGIAGRCGYLAGMETPRGCAWLTPSTPPLSCDGSAALSGAEVWR